MSPRTRRFERREEKILGQAKRIRSAFEEQISSARAKHLEESNHVELRTQELIQAKGNTNTPWTVSAR